MKRLAIIMVMLLASFARGDWLGIYDIDDYLPIHITTSQFSTGALITTANAQYRIYEETAGTFSTTEVVGPTALTMDFDAMTGLHLGAIQLSAANTFEAGKSYVVFVQATVDSVVAGTSHGFRIRAGSLATEAKQDTINTNVDDIETDTDNLQTSQGNWVTATGFATSGEPALALVAINLDHLVKNAVQTNLPTTVHDNSVIGYMLAKVNVTNYNRTDDSGEGRTDYGDVNWLTAGGFAVAGEPLTAQEVEDTVWDAVITKANRNVANSAGKKLRQVEFVSVLREEEQAQGGSASTITLHTDASAITGFYDDAQVVIVGDLGIGQSRHIHAYVGSTRIASITPDWITTPDATSDYVIMADSEKHVHEIDTDAINAATTSADYLAEINAEVDTALVDANLDHLVKNAVDTNLATTVHDDSVIGYILAGTNVSAYVRTEDSLEDLRDRGDAAWTTGGGSGLTPLGSGTAQSGTASTIVLAAASTFANNELNGAVINIHTGTGKGQHRVIVTNTLADDTCNVAPNWATNPSSNSQYEIIQGSVNITHVGGNTITDNDDGRLEVNVEEWKDTAVNEDTAGYPSVTVKDGTGTGEIDTDSGTVLLRSATETQIDNIEGDTNELQLDWVNGGRLDLILDAVKAYWDSLTITGGLLETDMKKLDGTAVKSTNGNIHALPGNFF